MGENATSEQNVSPSRRKLTRRKKMEEEAIAETADEGIEEKQKKEGEVWSTIKRNPDSPLKRKIDRSAREKGQENK